MRMRPTPEEAKRVEAQCRRRIENAKITWKHNDTWTNREKYYEAVRHSNEQADWYLCGILPLGDPNAK